MYDLYSSATARRLLVVTAATMSCFAAAASAQVVNPGQSLVRKVVGSGDKLEITTNSSRILTLDKKIPRVQVNNPELLAVTPLSATQVQVSAKKAGVTQVNLWDEEGTIHTVDVYIYGDVRELEHALKTQFPNSSIRVYRYSQSLVLTGFIDRPDYVDPIRQIAEDYAPKVINNIAVGGVQQVLLKVKIYEVSRTKLRQLGVDVGTIGEGGYFGTSVSGLLSNIGSGGNPLGLTQVGGVGVVKGITDTAGQTVEFAITNGADAFVGFIDALQERNAAKVLAEPNIVAVSGRPSVFRAGGEIPIPVPQGLGTVAIEYKPFGTQVDFLPIVLGNGKIRLEVRPSISELDFANALTINNFQVPALTDRMADTAVEMNAGQTFAIAGLIQQRSRTNARGIPFLSDLPFIGAPFRRVADDAEEIELLILVTPEFIDAMDPHEVPKCGPGTGTTSPSDYDLYINGKIEVPDYCSPCQNGSCPPCVSGGFPGTPPNFTNNGPLVCGPTGGACGCPSPEACGCGTEMVGTPVMAPGSPVMAPVHGDAVPVTPVMPVAPEEVPEPIEMGPTMGANPAGGRFQASAPKEFVRGAAPPYRSAKAPSEWKGGAALIGPIGYDDE